MQKLIEKTARKKKPKQIFWDYETEKSFLELIAAYDEELDAAKAIIKLIKQAVKDWYLPGYERKARVQIANELSKKLSDIAKKS